MRIVLALLLFALPAAAQGRIPADVIAEKDVEYGVANDVSLKLDIYRPKTPPQGLMAGIVWIHGGGWRQGDKNNASNAVAAAQRGFFAVSVNYRLSGEAVFPAAIEDCKGAIRWLRANAKKYGVDPDRIGVWGSSAGGHLALLAGSADESAGLEGKSGYATTSSRVQAVCSWFGPAEFKDEGIKSDAVAQFLGGSQKEKPEAWKLASPATHATKNDPPVLMVHGDKDRLVPLAQSETMLKALRAVEVEVELVVVKNAAHSFKPEGGEVEPTMKEIVKLSLDFFVKTLAPSEVTKSGEENSK